MHSDADAGLPYVREADVAVRLPGNAPADTYLRTDLLVDAARRSGADAVHPGYGFLSENADFARAVIDAGLTWVGPVPSPIDAMGSKIEAKRIMRAAGVPVLEAPAEPDRGRPAPAGEGVRRRRRPRDARRASPRRPRGRGRGRGGARRCRRSATARCSSSRTSSAGVTSRCRCSARLPSASGTAPSSVATRRWSRRRRHRTCPRTPATRCSRRRSRPPRRSTTRAPGPWSSWSTPRTPAASGSWR